MKTLTKIAKCMARECLVIYPRTSGDFDLHILRASISISASPLRTLQMTSNFGDQAAEFKGQTAEYEINLEVNGVVMQNFIFGSLTLEFAA